MQCATHPNTETELACSRCEKPICPRCLVPTPVGSRCRECANVRRIPTYNMQRGTFVRGIGAAIAAGVVLGIGWWIFNPLTAFYFGVIFGFAVGSGAGQAVSLATNRKAGPPLQAMGVGAVLLSYVVRTGLLFALSNWRFADLRLDLGGLIATGLASFIAAGRLR